MSEQPQLFRVLVAEDEPVSRRVVERFLKKWGYESVPATNGADAWKILLSPSSPQLAVVDWMMPEMDGLELCRRIRATRETAAHYVILLTARGGHGNTVQGLDAGADDFLSKPFDADELRARVQVGMRVVQLQSRLADRVQEVEAALARVKQLQGLVPICSYCKKIRNDQNYWQQLETFISEHSEAQFSHGICPDCLEKVIEPCSAEGPATDGRETAALMDTQL